MNLSYVYIGLIVLAVIAVTLYILFLKLRKNSFQLENSQQIKQDIQKYIGQIIDHDRTPLEERYATEIANGDAKFFKGSRKLEKTNILKKIAFLLFFIVLIIIFWIIYNPSLLKINTYLSDCLNTYETIILLCFFTIMLWLSYHSTLLIKSIFFKVKQGRQTGWDGDITKSYSYDKIIFRYTKKTEVDNFIHIFIIVICNYFYFESFLTALFEPITSYEMIRLCFG